MTLTKRSRKMIVCYILILTPVFSTVAAVLGGADWRTMLGKLMIDLPASALGVFMHPPKVEGDTEDLPVVIEEPKP